MNVSIANQDPFRPLEMIGNNDLLTVDKMSGSVYYDKIVKAGDVGRI
jgi:hypothetical protein